MNKTLIPWVKNPDGTQGYTWNPITGCLNGCEYCYARKLANGRLKSRYLANENIAPIGTMIVGAAMNEKALKDPFYPRFWEDRIWDLRPQGQYDKAWNRDNRRWGSEKGIFVCDMSDLFGIGIPEAWTNRVLEEIKIYSQHRFYLLTKQPQNLIKFSPFPDNCWVGVSATNRELHHKAQLELDYIKAKVNYISFEPLLGEVTISPYDFSPFGGSIDWVIIGAQTKPYKPPKIEWVEEITRACDRANIPVFHKNNLKPIFPAPTNTLRQEMPK